MPNVSQGSGGAMEWGFNLGYQHRGHRDKLKPSVPAGNEYPGVFAAALVGVGSLQHVGDLVCLCFCNRAIPPAGFAFYALAGFFLLKDTELKYTSAAAPGARGIFAGPLERLLCRALRVEELAEERFLTGLCPGLSLCPLRCLREIKSKGLPRDLLAQRFP